MLTSSIPPVALNSLQRRVIVISWLTYAAYYLGRVNLSTALSDLSLDLNLSKAAVGAFGSGFFWAYAIGQLVNGRLGDRYNTRRFVTIGLLVSAVLNLLFGSFSAWLPLMLLWTLNGYFQATGWGPILRTLANSLSSTQRRRISGLFGSCFVAGNAFTWLLTGWLVREYGWRSAFWVPGLLMVGAALLWYLLSKDSTPADLSPDPEAAVDPDLDEQPVSSFGQTLRRQWSLILAAVFLGFTLVALIVWTPTYFVDVIGLDIGRAASLSALFPFAGIAGTLLVGWLVGRFFHKREARTLGLLLVLLAIMFTIFPALPATAVVSTLSLMAVGSVLYAASSMLLTTMPLVLGGRLETSSMAGLIDFSFNIGAGLSSGAIGWVLDRGSWNTVFFILAGAALCSAVFIAITLVLESRRASLEVL